ncbi:MAG TPA: iron ABC transporter substrate-binding protein [Oceanobacillus sp.]|nr:iron ABC transporter substrate-binding protein [Oceanobacillus sp.]
MRLFIRMMVLTALLMLAFPLSAQEGETLTVYSGRSEGLIGPILEQFTADTGINVEVRYGSTPEMAALISEEGDNSPADVFIAQDAGALGALSAEGRLLTLPSDILERVPAEFTSATGQWVGISGRARVLVYNTELVSEDQLPASILDLVNPEWQGLVGWAPSNASLQANVTAMRVLLGEDAAREWLEGMVANGAVAYEANPAVVQAVINGEVSVGLVNHYYIFQFLADDPDLPVAMHFFPAGDVGALINIAGAGVVSSSDTPGLAQRLILYLLGNDAQIYFREQTSEYPLIAGVEPKDILPPLSEIEAPEIDLNQLADLQGTQTLLQETGALPG